MTIVFEDDLVLEENKTFEESIKVKGNIRCLHEKYYSLKVKGDINAQNIDAWDIKAGDIDAGDIDAGNIDAGDIDAWDIKAGDIDAGDIDAGNIDAWHIDATDISFHAFCISHHSLKCLSIEGRRENSLYDCLDGEVEFKEG